MATFSVSLPARGILDVPAELVGRTVGEAMVRAPKVLDPSATVADLHAFFLDDHVHAALVVDGAGRLLSVVRPTDLDGRTPSQTAVEVGRLSGRVVSPDVDLVEAWDLMLRRGQRRLAVADARGRLLGLLCLKRSGRGFCSDAGVAARSPADRRPA